MATRHIHWKRAVPTIALTAIPFTAFCPTSVAFFPPVNNQLTSMSPPTVVAAPPRTPPVTVVPPVSPPPFLPPPTPPQVIGCPAATPPVVVRQHHECHGTTPEPSTLVVALTGLMAAAGLTARRRKSSLGETAS